MPGFHPLILLTDFGTRDAYVASMKGVILSVFPKATVVDLTHEIEPQNIKQAAFVLATCASYFPKGCVFVSVVDPGVGSERQIVAAKTDRGIFLAPDNGLLTLILREEKVQAIRTVTNKRFFLERVSSTFHGRDCFAPTAARLAKNPTLFSKVGPLVKEVRKLKLPEPVQNKDRIVGEILYFDHFGNAFTNIDKAFVKSAGKERNVSVRVEGKDMGKIRRSYFEVLKGAAVAVFSSSDILELAVNQGSAREQLGLREGTRVEVVRE